MELEGKVIFVGQEKTGTSKSTGKEWRSNEFVIEIPGQYVKHVKFSTFNDTCNVIPDVNTFVKVSFDIDANEWNGKYYNDLRAYRIDIAGQTNSAPQQAPQSQQTDQPHPVASSDPLAGTQQAQEPEKKSDDLPF